MDQLDAMRAFVEVATLASFSKAARRIRQSPSATTRAVAQLEDQLGLTLLTRTTRAVRLTERGQIYLESCRQILEDVGVAQALVRGESAEPRGHLKIAAPVLFGRLHILPVVTQLLNRYPAISVHLTLSDRNIHLVEDSVDVAIRIGDLADSRLMAVRLGSVNRVLVASPAYLAVRPPPGKPSDLVYHDIIAFESLETTHDWRFTDTTVVRLEPRLEINSADAAIAAAESGLGITRALSYQVRDAIQSGRLIPLLTPFTPPAVPVSAVYPSRRIASANVATFVSLARDHFRARPVEPLGS